MNIDERLEALTMNLELLYHTVQENAKKFETLVSSVQALVRVVESHERRLTDIEGGTG